MDKMAYFSGPILLISVHPVHSLVLLGRPVASQHLGPGTFVNQK